jgi:hypothetical protein
MTFNSLANVTLGLFQTVSSCNATREVRNISGPVILRPLKDYSIPDTHFLSSNPAALRIDFRVPMGTSSPRCPGTVTILAFAGCLK